MSDLPVIVFSEPSLQLVPLPAIEVVVEQGENFVVEINLLPSLVSIYEINEYFEVLPILYEGQTQFQLSYTPTTPDRAKLFLNGQKLAYQEDYNIVVNTLDWTDDVLLEISDELEIYYY